MYKYINLYYIDIIIVMPILIILNIGKSKKKSFIQIKTDKIDFVEFIHFLNITILHIKFIHF